jgi:predicted N-acyltransferase
MQASGNPHLEIQVAHSIAEFAPDAWDALTGGAPFQSHCWYRFGEAVMADCEPTYLTVSEDGRALARAALWRVRDEPLPIIYAPAGHLLQAYLRRRPLMICRSPLSSMPGVLLPPPPLREAALPILAAAAREQAEAARASFLVFDFLTPGLRDVLACGLVRGEVSGPGTVMDLPWRSFDEFVGERSRNERKHYQRTLRHAAELGITVTRHRQVERIPEALELIRNMERRFRSAPNPWMKGMMEHIHQVDGTWLAATIGDRLVGCELLLQDNGAQLVTALGLAHEVPYVYFALGYEDIRVAIESGVRTLYWGSGAYDVKRRLGFSLYPNNLVAFAGLGFGPRLMARAAAAVL